MFLSGPAWGDVDIPAAIATMWKALGVIWLVGMVWQRPAAIVLRQSRSSWLFQTAIAALGFGLLVTNWFRFGWLAARFVPQSLWVEYAGFALTLAGCLFAIWARVVLGGNWSSQITLQQGHSLIEEGPYTLARHPIYLGFVLAFVGTVLVVGEVRALFGLVLILVRLAWKMSQEEKLMLQAFPSEYPEYRRRVKALIPGVL
jgi:protein-S-isoprenylcysteine O-methyltransferase Ste14